MRNHLRSARLFLLNQARGADWGMIVLVAAFVFIAPIGTFLGRRTPNLAEFVEPPVDDREIYRAAIHEAAVRTPADQVTLRTIEPTASMVKVANFGFRAPASGPSDRVLWVTLPDELAKACAGSDRPARRLLEILGLPPDRPGTREERRIFLLEVPRAALSRPCIFGGDPAKPTCSAASIAAVRPSSAPSAADHGPGPASVVAPGAALLPVARDVPDPRYLEHLWNSYRTDFSQDGFPFTGMGWTFDWGKGAPHIGVSEFVVAQNSEVTPLGSQTPRQFCAKAAATTP
jgi:hypothetical protein